MAQEDQDILPEQFYIEEGKDQIQQIEEQKEALDQFQMEYIQSQMTSTFTPQGEELDEESIIDEQLYKNDPDLKFLCDIFISGKNEDNQDGNEYDNELMTVRQIVDLYKEFDYDTCFEKLLSFYEEIENNQADYHEEIGHGIDEFQKAVEESKEEEYGSSLIIAEEAKQEINNKMHQPRRYDKLGNPIHSDESSDDDGESNVVMEAKPFKPNQIKRLFQ